MGPPCPDAIDVSAMSRLPEAELTPRADRMMMEILRRSHLCAPHELSTILAEEVRRLGVDRLVLHLADLEQRVLVPVPGPDAGDGEPLSVNGTTAGRCFATTTVLDVEVPEGRRVWLPLLDGTERVGVMDLRFPGPVEELPEALVAVCTRLAHLAALLIASKDAYSDVFKLVRRRERMTTATELLRALLPPQVLATDDFVLATFLEPAYDAGGDAYDYALNEDVLHVGIFDGVGHGLGAAGLTAFALSLHRAARRAGEDLPVAYAAMDTEVAAQFAVERYVTVCLAQLDVRSGRLRWINAGHPAPLLLRDGRFVKELEVPRVPPVGLQLADGPPAVGEAWLQPGDMVLLYTDGLTESRRPDGGLFTTPRLAEFIEREAAAGEAAPETLRRLRDAIIERRAGLLRDDATAVLVEWRRGTERALLPEPA